MHEVEHAEMEALAEEPWQGLVSWEAGWEAWGQGQQLQRNVLECE